MPRPHPPAALPCPRHPGVLPPPAEGHRGVRRAEDRVLPEPAGGGQRRALLPAHRAEPGEWPAGDRRGRLEARGIGVTAWGEGSKCLFRLHDYLDFNLNLSHFAKQRRSIAHHVGMFSSPVAVADGH